ncbi:MAG: hypothetical protein RR365_13105 [Bacteroides sp.]
MIDYKVILRFVDSRPACRCATACSLNTPVQNSSCSAIIDRTQNSFLPVIAPARV